MSKIELKIITPEKLILDEMVDSVSLPTTKGEITILPAHVPLIGTMASGDIVARINEEEVPIAVVGGFVEVKKKDTGESIVIILCDFAEHVSNLSDEVIERAKARAEELKKQRDSKEVVDFEHFESELERSITQIRIADKWRSKKYRK
jgi:F-type H+-transporting ATPase subunit epsilon